MTVNKHRRPSVSGAVFAIDPGMTLGWCLAQPSGDFTCGTLVGGPRLLARWFASVMRNTAHKPLVVIERVYREVTGKHFENDFVAHQVRELERLADAYGLTVWYVDAMEPKSLINDSDKTGRRMPKKQARAAVHRITGVSPKTFHESDAVLIALYVKGLSEKTVFRNELDAMVVQHEQLGSLR